MLIETYDLEITSPPCEPGSERWSAFAALEQDISDVLPYLNAVWPHAIYDHTGKVLTRRMMQGHGLAIRARQIGISNLQDRSQAVALVEQVIQEINDIWMRRSEITPCFAMRRRPAALDIYRLLPGTNCKACGQPTCLTFALQLAAGNTDLATCTPLQSPEYAEQRQKLQDVFGLS